MKFNDKAKLDNSQIKLAPWRMTAAQKKLKRDLKNRKMLKLK